MDEARLKAGRWLCVVNASWNSELAQPFLVEAGTKRQARRSFGRNIASIQGYDSKPPSCMTPVRYLGPAFVLGTLRCNGMGRLLYWQSYRYRGCVRSLITRCLITVYTYGMLSRIWRSMCDLSQSRICH